MLNTNFRTVAQTTIEANNASAYAMPILNAAIAASKEVSLAERITKAFGLTADQSSYVAQILAKDKKDGDKFEQEQKAIYYAASVAQKDIIDGTYTIVSPSGNHKTIELTTNINPKEEFFFGKRTVRLMVGSNNESDYKNFGFFSNTKGISVFKKSLEKNIENRKTNKNEVDLQKVADFASSLLIDGKEGKAAKIGFTIEVSKTCIVCGRKLTNPASLCLSIGPKCYNDIHG